MTGETVPNFDLPNLFSSDHSFTPKNFHGHAVLLNVWASWCSACKYEHAMLMRLKNEYHVPIYGILYRDNASDAIDWLHRKGNPYVIVGNDANGDASVDLGIYGTPETFVVSPKGKIIYRHVGVITQRLWDDTIQPLLKKYED
jgi:cytochrome c biogenesis protein CcmG/thiol:disulfide interchange protein DsbE